MVVSIEDLVAWAYRDCAVGGPTGEQAWLAGSGRSGCGVDQVAEAAALGARIAGSAYRRDTTPDLALDIDMMVDVVGGHAAALIRRYGRIGGRPDWGRDMRPRFEPLWKRDPVRDGAGRPVPAAVVVIREYDLSRNRKRAWCPVRLHDPPELIEAKRVAYRLWWDGLATLARALDQVLADRTVAPPACPREPWKIPLALYEKN